MVGGVWLREVFVGDYKADVNITKSDYGGGVGGGR